MNTDTGHLILLDSDEEPPEGYTKLPDDLARDAILKLAGKKEAAVSLTSGGKLSEWASRQRRKRERQKARKRGIKFPQDQQ